MKRYVIERDLPGVGAMNRAQRFSQMSFERGELVGGGH